MCHSTQWAIILEKSFDPRKPKVGVSPGDTKSTKVIKENCYPKSEWLLNQQNIDFFRGLTAVFRIKVSLRPSRTTTGLN